MTTEVNNPSAPQREGQHLDEVACVDDQLAGLSLEDLVERITSDLMEGKPSEPADTARMRKALDEQLATNPEHIGSGEQVYARKLLSVWDTLHLYDKPEEVRLRALNRVRAEYLRTQLSGAVSDLSVPFDEVYQQVQELGKDILSITPIDAEVLQKSQAHLGQLRNTLLRRADADPERVAEEYRANRAKREEVLAQLETLLTETDVELAHERYKALLTLWPNLGGVPAEDKEPIAQRFKDLRMQVREYVRPVIERLDREAEANAVAKEAICQRIEELTTNLSEASPREQWQSAYEEVQTSLKSWLQVGEVSGVQRKELQYRFQQVQEVFFAKLRTVGIVIKERDLKGLSQRRELVDRVNALKDSTDWKTTAEAIKQIQGEWKLIGGPSSPEHQKLWEEFSSATNYFFERRKASREAQRKGQASLKEQREQILARLQALLEEPLDGVADELQKCKEAWQALPPTPSRTMRGLQESYRDLVGKVHQRIRQERRDKARLDGYKARLSKLGAGSELKDEGRKIRQLLGNAERELKTFDGNLGRFSALASSGYGGGLAHRRGELEREVERLREQLRLVDEHAREGSR